MPGQFVTVVITIVSRGLGVFSVDALLFHTRNTFYFNKITNFILCYRIYY